MQNITAQEIQRARQILADTQLGWEECDACDNQEKEIEELKRENAKLHEQLAKYREHYNNGSI